MASIQSRNPANFRKQARVFHWKLLECVKLRSVSFGKERQVMGMVDAEVGKLGVLARNRLYLGGKAYSLSTN